MTLKLFFSPSRSVAVTAAGRAGKVPAQVSASLTSCTEPFPQTSLSPWAGERPALSRDPLVSLFPGSQPTAAVGAVPWLSPCHRTVQIPLRAGGAAWGETLHGRNGAGKGAGSWGVPDATCAQGQRHGGTKPALGLLWSRAPGLQSRKHLRGVTQLPGRRHFTLPGNTLAKQDVSLGV